MPIPYERLFLTGIGVADDRLPSRDVYPFTIPAIASLRDLAFKQPVTFLVGENGTGKSTLLEAIAVAWGLNPEGGSMNFHFSTRDTHSGLGDALRLSRGRYRPRDGFFLRAESFYNVATAIDAMDNEPSFALRVIASYGGTSLHELSHGESFFALFMNRLGVDGLYMFDEPEAALSPQREIAYRDTEHYTVTRNFLVRTEQMLDVLLDRKAG